MDTLLQKHPSSLYTHGFISTNHLSDSASDRHLDFPCGFSDVDVTSSEGVHQGDCNVEADYFDGVLRYINQMLNEEEVDLDDRPFMFQDCLALQAAEKSFYDVLNDQESVVNSHPSGIFCPSNHLSNHGSFLTEQWKKGAEDDYANYRLGGSVETSGAAAASSHSNPSNDSGESMPTDCGSQNSSFGSRRKNNHHREEEDDDHHAEGRRSKQIASFTEGPEEENEKETYDYDKALLCPKMNPNFYKETSSIIDSTNDVAASENDESDKWKDYSRTAKRGRPRTSDKQNSSRTEVVDLRGLLTRCAQAVSGYDSKTAGELFKQIRHHSSPYGDATERLAHYFADALEARINSIGPALYSACSSRKLSGSGMLKAYQTYVTACPFKRMSNIFANKSIAKQVGEVPRIHIIDFGIAYGFQWPCIIHGLSLRPGGPPRLRITGIDFPQPGFRPAERIEKTGERLANFCHRFDVPFEYNAVAKKWDAITLEDLKIDRENEKIFVNCLYRLRHVPDEAVSENSPRDRVLDLIKKINPDLFVHGVLNGTYNAPFFGTRFREALFHFSSLFDMFETTVPREDQDRLMYEREFFGRDIMNIIACEGAERVERPETYKQWQGRVRRAGFRQLPLNQEIMKEVTAKVRWSYHRDFLVDQDSKWMLQGWKGRVLYALSCWKPSNK